MCNWIVCEMHAEEICKQIIDDLIKDGYRHQIPHKDLAKIIMQKRGIDERTVAKWVKALIAFDFITPIETTVYKVYTLNPAKIPAIFKVLNEKPQTKLQ